MCSNIWWDGVKLDGNKEGLILEQSLFKWNRVRNHNAEQREQSSSLKNFRIQIITVVWILN
jgi:hypothetical protein